MASITYEHVSKVFSHGAAAAVVDLNLEIHDREFMVLVGPSGCGKTTALRMLAGLEDVSEGVIRIGDRVVNDVDARDRDIAMVFQSYALYPHMSVRDNLAFGLKMRHTPRDEIDKRVEEASRVLELDALLKRKPGQLSGGQRQRVALGRAIVRHPQAFLLDEPLSNLDAKLRVQTRIQLQRLHKRLGTTFIYVTHDQVEAMTMGDRIAVMRDGVLQQVDEPHEIYHSPMNMYVAGFIGSPAINFFPAVVDDRRVTAAGFAFDLARPTAAREVVLGIRPETFTPVARPGDVELDIAVDLVETPGADKYIYGRLGPDPITARVEPELRVAPGDRVRLAVAPSLLLVFDVATQLRLNMRS